MITQDGAQPFPASAQQVETVAAGMFIRLLEEMLDLKIQHHMQPQMTYTPEIAQIMHQKRQTDLRRLERIRAELIGLLKA